MRYLRSPLAGVFSRTSDDSPYTLPNLAAKYDLSLDASTTSSNIRIDSSNRVSLVADTSGNSAVNALVNNGGGGTATAPGKSVTGSFTITADVQLSTFVPAANLDLFNNQSGNTGLFFRLQTDGTLRLTVGDGATQTNAFSSATGLTANTRHTLSAVWVDGVGVTFQIDGVNHGTQQALAKTLASSGATATVCSGVIGAVYRVQCGSFYDFNPSLAAKLATQVVSGGDTWTVTTSGATGARISGARDLYQGTLASQPIYLPWSGTNYAYFRNAAADTATAPLANGTYDVAITYYDGTTASTTTTVAAGTVTIGGTDANYAGITKRTARVVFSQSAVTKADFNPGAYTSGTTFTASTGEVWTLNAGAAIVGRTTMYFDGSDDYLKAAPFSLSQPETVYLVGRQVTWTSGDYLIDGNASNSGALTQSTGTPQINLNAGSSVAGNTGLAVKTMGVLSAVYNGASSALRVNRGTATTGNAGAANMSGFTLASAGTAGSYGNQTTNEALVYSVAHDTPTQDRVIQYEAKKWGVSV
jgi:hypothetical protein